MVDHSRSNRTIAAAWDAGEFGSDNTYKVELTDTNGVSIWVACSHESEVNKLIAYTSRDNKYTAADVYCLTSKHKWPSVDIQVDCVEGAVLELNEPPRVQGRQ